MGVRFRSALVAVLVVAVGLLAGALALVALLRAELTDDVRDSARTRARQVASVIDSGRGVPSLTVAQSEEEFVQVLDAGGAVVAASPNAAGLPALARPGTEGESRVRTPLDEDEFLVVAERAQGPGTHDARRTVVAGRALNAVAETTSIVTGLLAVGLPLLLLLAFGATWAALGRVLAPVARIQAEVEAISSAALHRRVPLPRGRDEIARLAATMNRMLERLESAQKAQRRFVSDASHELRSPVTAVRQHAEVALAHPGRTTAEELAATVLTEDLRLQRLVEDLLLLARADEDALRPRLRETDLDDLVLEEVRRLRDAHPALGIRAAEVTPVRLTADAQALRRVLRNLGDNAARYARSRVEFALGTDEAGRAVVRVEDDGPGVPEAERERIFARFVRLDDARVRPGEPGGGSGLGLAIVAELVTAHGGIATVSASPLGGACFEVALPRTAAM
ncbi:HAMP domain-containing histidine kinase [Streptomyces sp. NA04227]|uniref:HAMP domain-containing sensor histidine kinase n=1 Tax=Streptomyces sp. NA04227 TaxID=2742136 RepID=UPI0015918E52|nr:HAMP domain-containing sensor histidine kinase [Streptomyces sp. NA04227]QKW06476.1 HAMP domain-containing histidine kinase [Streptomyces sp. NA04227]